MRQESIQYRGFGGQILQGTQLHNKSVLEEQILLVSYLHHKMYYNLVLVRIYVNKICLKKVDEYYVTLDVLQNAKVTHTYVRMYIRIINFS